MEDSKNILKFLLELLGVVTCLWLYLKLLSFLHWKLFSFLYERGWNWILPPRRANIYDEPSKVEIQTLFHGNTKDDEDQL